jgi:hypothetical protein
MHAIHTCSSKYRCRASIELLSYSYARTEEIVLGIYLAYLHGQLVIFVIWTNIVVFNIYYISCQGIFYTFAQRLIKSEQWLMTKLYGKSRTVICCYISIITYAYMIAYEIFFRFFSSVLMNSDRTFMGRETRQARENRKIRSNPCFTTVMHTFLAQHISISDKAYETIRGEE